MNATGTTTRISLKDILYATDFSPSAEAALPYVIGLAKRYGAKVHGFHVRFPATFPIVGPEDFPEVIEAAHELAKMEAVDLHRKLSGVPHEVSVCEGELWPVISDAVTKQKTDLIVIGTRGRTGVGRLFLGSVAEEIFRRASCPVLTVGPQVSQDTGRRLEMREILYATDFSSESVAALPYAVSMAQEFQSRLTLLHVVGNAKVGDLVHAEHYAGSIQRQLQKLLPPEADAWCEPNCVVEHGGEADKILEIATALGADLIVLGVRGVEDGIGVATHLFGSVAHEVVTRAQCPVLTVRG
jgi:nucleotide-binding universal stress UspA family protein